MATVDRVLDVVNEIGDHIGAGGGGAITGLQEGFLGEQFLKELFTVLGEAAPLLTKAVGNAAGEVSPQIAEAIKQVSQTVSENLSFSIQGLDDLPGPFSKGTAHAFENLRSLGDISNCLNVKLDIPGSTVEVHAIEFVRIKIQLVVGSLEKLLTLTSGASGNSEFLFSALFEGLGDLFEQAFNPNGPDISVILGESLISKFLSAELIEAILNAAIERKSMFWTDLPGGEIVGKLHEWINNSANFDMSLCGTSDAWQISFDRSYRIRLIAAFDAFFSQRIGGDLENSLSNADQRVSFELLSDVVAIFFDQTIKFVLEPHCVPGARIDLGEFDDIGYKLGKVSAQQLNVPIKGIVGIIFRGVSFLSINNSAFIELVASIVSRFFAGIVDAVVLNLTATIRIVGIYGATPPGLEGELHRWQTMEAIEGNLCESADRLEYAVLLRRPDLVRTSGGCSLGTLRASALIRGLAMDVGAYMDMSYLTYLEGARFNTSVVADVVTIVRAEYVAGKLLIEVTTDQTLAVPQPVLRAYFCCRVVVMRPGKMPTDPYRIDVICESLPADATVKVLSNLGGTTVRSIVRV